jgi:hypothetical protein
LFRFVNEVLRIPDTEDQTTGQAVTLRKGSDGKHNSVKYKVEILSQRGPPNNDPGSNTGKGTGEDAGGDGLKIGEDTLCIPANTCNQNENCTTGTEILAGMAGIGWDKKNVSQPTQDITLKEVAPSGWDGWDTSLRVAEKSEKAEKTVFELKKSSENEFSRHPHPSIPVIPAIPADEQIQTIAPAADDPWEGASL